MRQGEEWWALKALGRVISPRVIQLATAALDAGRSPSEVAEACVPMSWSTEGSAAAFYGGLAAEYDALRQGTDLRPHPVGEQGFAWASRLRDEAAVHERHEQVYGHG